MEDENQITDPWTLKLEALLVDIATAARENNKRYYFGGGFAIDLNLGKLTRAHEDLDFYPEEKDTEWWKEWFKSKGFIISKDSDMANYPNAFLLTNENNDYFADVYPVRIEKSGEISMLRKDSTHGTWEGKSFKEVRHVDYKNTSVYVENPATVIKQKLKHASEHQAPLSEKHKLDIENYEKYLKSH